MAGLIQRLKASRDRKRRRTELAPGFRRMTGRHYHDVLTQIEQRLTPDWYLEIGSRSGTSIAHRSCNFVAVDPEFAVTADVFNSARQMHFMQQTSDAFFASGFLGKLGIVPDFAFVDGMHLFEFALRDFINAEAAMAPAGLIALHDVCPYDHGMALREATPEEAPFAWTGDVWKTIVILKELRPDLQIDVLSASSTGLACIRGLDPENDALSKGYEGALAKYTDMTLADYGVERYFDLVAPRDPDDFLAGLGQATRA